MRGERLRRESETAADDLFQRDSSKLWSMCRVGERRVGNGTGQLAVLRNKKGALVTTPLRVWVGVCGCLWRW